MKVVDTTGAGDGFAAGLLLGLARRAKDRAALEAGRPEMIEQLAHFPCVVGSAVVTQLGAVAGLPTQKQVKRSLPGGW